jgi:GR25 family glycosyltransferase involved in LPS biosynthesis
MSKFYKIFFIVIIINLGIVYYLLNIYQSPEKSNVYVEEDTYLTQKYLYSEESLNNLKHMGLQDIYVINLKNRPERLQHMIDILQKPNLPFLRLNAFHGVKMKDLLQENKPIEGLNPKSKVKYEPTLKRLQVDFPVEDWGVVGCWQSHLHVYWEIIKRAELKSEDKPILIFEDDAIVPDNFAFELRLMIRALPDDWEIFPLSLYDAACITKIANFFCKIKKFYTAHAYVLRNSTVAKKLADRSNTDTVDGADNIWNPMMEEGKLNGYSLTYQFIYQTFRDSNIPSTSMWSTFKKNPEEKPQ